MDDESKPVRGESRYWLDLIEQSDKYLREWQDASDNIDKAYANLSELRNAGRDSAFALFWSNIQVLGPSIYARPPAPVVTPKFKDRRPLYRTASEMLERCCVVSFDMADIDETMTGLRDDLSISGRGVAWVRYESKDGDKVCYDYIDRKDFMHTPGRRWKEVDACGPRAWLTREEMRERFGEAADDVEYTTRRDNDERGGSYETEKCGVWEIWCRSEKKVVWVTEGCPTVLDECEPYLKLGGFFPCPRPAYATLQRRSLIPVPDMLFYKDQLEEVNILTRRIHALSDAIKARGFYTGSGDVGAAIERAMLLDDDGVLLVPIPDMQSLMQGNGDPIIWLPIDMLAATITGLVELRRQVIDDVYQIIGLSDIMRGSTVASETLGAQQLKQQNGSYRVRDKQNELVRMARDLVRIGAEIMANEFGRKSLEDMAQMDLPTQADLSKQIKQLTATCKAELTALADKAESEAKEAMGQMQQSGQQSDPAQMKQMQQQAEQQFQQAQQQIIGKYAPQIEGAATAVSIDAVMEFLQDEKLRPFVLDIETDSTIYPDEMAEKQSRQEFMGAFAGTLQSLMPLFQLGPEAVSVAGGVIKFALAPYRVGRELEGLIDDFADKGPEMAQRMQDANAQGQDQGLAEANKMLAEAEMVKAQAATMTAQARAANDQAALQGKMQDMQIKAAKDQQEGQLKVGQLQLTMSKQEQDFAAKMAETDAKIDKMRAETAAILQGIGLDARKQDLSEYQAADASKAQQVDQSLAVQGHARAARDSDRSAEMQERQQTHAEHAGQRSQSFAEQQAMKGQNNG